MCTFSCLFVYLSFWWFFCLSACIYVCLFSLYVYLSISNRNTKPEHKTLIAMQIFKKFTIFCCPNKRGIYFKGRLYLVIGRYGQNFHLQIHFLEEAATFPFPHLELDNFTRIYIRWIKNNKKMAFFVFKATLSPTPSLNHS